MLKRKLLPILLVIIMSISLAACAAPAAATAEAIETADVAEQAEAPQTEEPQFRTVTDMAGRTHEIPTEIDRIFCTSPVGTIMLYTLAPDKLIGWNYEFNDYELEYIAPEYRDLPVFGTIQNANFEALLAEKPDIILAVGSVDEKTAEKIDGFQEQLNTPMIMIDDLLVNTAEAYTFLGSLIGEEEQAALLADYAEGILSKVASVEIPEDKQVTVYYGNGINSLNTSARGTTSSETFDMLGAVNVCDLESDSPNRFEITAEHLIGWDPDYIFVNGEPTESFSATDAKNDILSNPAYASLSAVKNDRIITIPKSPFAWIDRPKSSNRLIGLLWVGSIVYPDYYTFTDSDFVDFYKLFYHIDITSEDIDTLYEKE